MASKNTSYFPKDHNSGNVYRLATSVLLGVDILLRLWKRISISTHVELDDRWHDSCEATIKFYGTTCIFKQCLVSINGSYDKEIFSVWLTECNSLQADIDQQQIKTEYESDELPHEVPIAEQSSFFVSLDPHETQKLHEPTVMNLYHNNQITTRRQHYISHKVLQDNIISADYKWAKNHVKNMNNIFETMEPLWQTTAANDPLRNMILSGECKKAIKKLYIRIKRHHLYWNEAAATTDESET
ncbi:uncharacterized protein [Acropora muricata]|uniref:uncharacterized protein n=1 Tax=Acropora muricata TaxID=159855 RepID=UPI0034E3B761